MRSSILVFGFLALLPSSHAADTKDQQQADAPVLGYAFAETSRELRAILGVPGSSRWSDAIPLSEGVTTLRIANGHRWALAVSSNETAVLQLDTLQSKRLETAGSFDAALFSPSGTAVAIRRGSTVAVYTGMPDAPAKSNEFQSSDDLAALSDSGAAIAIRDGRIVNAATGELVYACAVTCRAAYFPETTSLAVFEAGGRLVELRDGEARAITQGLQMDEMKWFHAGSSRIGLAGKDKLLVVERVSGAIAAEEALTGADRMEAMRLPGCWLLSAASEETATWLYSNEGVRFVPAASAARSKEQ